MRHNFSVEGVAVVDEVIVRAHSTPDRIGHDLIKAGGFEVWTGPGKTGTALVVGTDFDLSVKDTKRTARAEFDIYTLFAVINATYLNTTLYLTYTSCGDYLSIENVGDAVCENITLAGTNGAVPLDAMVTGERRRYFKTGAYHASGYVFSASGATFEGRASITLYGQYSFVEIERISATLFAIRDLKESIQTTTGKITRYADGRVVFTHSYIATGYGIPGAHEETWIAPLWEIFPLDVFSVIVSEPEPSGATGRCILIGSRTESYAGQRRFIFNVTTAYTNAPLIQITGFGHW